MNNYPIISIVTPSLNQGCFIEETLNSVLSQEGDFNLDYIIVDGGSTDNSLEIIKKYDVLLKEGKYPIRCRGIEYHWISESDKGQAEAINKGFRMANGEILAWLNSDDTYDPYALSKIIAVCDSNPKIGLIYGDCSFIDDQNNVIMADVKPRGFNLAILRERNILMQPSVFIKRSVFDNVGLLNTNLYFVLDYDLWIRASLKFRGKYIPFTLANFRIHNYSKTFDQNLATYRAELLLVLKWYGHTQSFIKRFGEYAYTFYKDKKINIITACSILKNSFLKNNQLKISPSLEKYLFQGKCYGYLLYATHHDKIDRKLERDIFSLILFNAPRVLLNRYGLILLLKLVLKRKIF